MSFKFGEIVLIEGSVEAVYLDVNVSEDYTLLLLVRRGDGRGWSLIHPLGKSLPPYLKNRAAVLGFTDCFWYAYRHDIKKVGNDGL